MWPDRVSNPGPLTYESGALPTGLCGPTKFLLKEFKWVQSLKNWWSMVDSVCHAPPIFQRLNTNDLIDL